MKFLLLLVLLFLSFSFVSGAYPGDYSFYINHNDYVWNWIVRDSDPPNNNLYPASDSSSVNFGTLYTHLLEGSIEFDFNNISTANFIFAAGPQNWYPAIEGVNADGDSSTRLDSRIRLQFLDSSGVPLQFTDQYSNSSNPDIRYISPGCDDLYLDYPLTSIYFDDEDFDESCEFVIENPIFREQLNSFKINYNFDLAIRASTRPYFYPIIEGPILSYFDEDCLSSPSLDEDRDGYWGCLDPDCNGQIPGGSVTPSECTGFHHDYQFESAYTWNGSNWINSEEYWCTAGTSGYCCPLWWNWNSGILQCEPSSPSGYCGDSIIQTPNGYNFNETCDRIDLGGENCTSIPGGFDGGTLDCLGDCSDFNTVLCTSNVVEECGDNIIQAPNDDGLNETCDGSANYSETCITEGFDNGTLACYAAGTQNECTFDTSDCSSSAPGPAPIVGPNEYIVYTACEDDGDGNQYGVAGWTLYSGAGNQISNDSSLCVLYSSDVPFSGIFGILLFFLLIFGFYFKENYLNE